MRTTELCHLGWVSRQGLKYGMELKMWIMKDRKKLVCTLFNLFFLAPFIFLSNSCCHCLMKRNFPSNNNEERGSLTIWYSAKSRRLAHVSQELVLTERRIYHVNAYFLIRVSFFWWINLNKFLKIISRCEIFFESQMCSLEECVCVCECDCARIIPRVTTWHLGSAFIKLDGRLRQLWWQDFATYPS